MKRLKDYHSGQDTPCDIGAGLLSGLCQMVDDLASRIEALDKDNDLLRGEINRLHKKIDQMKGLGSPNRK